MYTNDNIENNENQLVLLNDKKSNGKERPWRDKKVNNELLTDTYNRIGYKNKAFRTGQCGKYLEFKVFEDGKMRLNNANFCQVRLCPMCSWRRELKIFSELSKVVQNLEEDGYRFVFLTLTCKTVYGDDLGVTLDNFFDSFKRLFELKQVKKSVKGYFRALEITHDTEPVITKKMYKRSKKYYDDKLLKVGDLNPNFNKYHPHFHILLAVRNGYFKKPELYIKQSEWVHMWQQSLRVDYIPVVHVEVVKNESNKGVKELAKYTVKDSDYIVKQDKKLTDETVAVLDGALAHRRLIAYGGVMRDVHKRLNLSDDVSADVHIDDNQEIIDMPYILQRFNWHIGFKNYVLVEDNKNGY